MKSRLPRASIEKPRPPSAGLNHQPVCGACGRQLTDPGTHARALTVPGAHLFDPSGRGQPFRQWVVLPPEQAAEWEPLAAEAVVQDHSIPPPGPEAKVSD
jgi:hypothetical protein